MAQQELVRHVSVTLRVPPSDVYAFAREPMNLPQWAAGLSTGIRQEAGEWVTDSPIGQVKVRFVEENRLGVLDHVVVLPSGEEVYNPMRVVPNGKGSELCFTLFRRAGMTQAQFDDDSAAVLRDLEALKALLEAENVRAPERE